MSIGLADISEAAWRKRLRASNPWLVWLVGELLAAPSPPPGPAVPGSRRVRLVDATRLRQPSGTGDDWRVHFSYDCPAGRMDEVVVTDQHSAERLAHFTWQAGDIVVADHGYGYRTSVATAVRQHADVVLRITPATFPVATVAGEACDLVAWLRQSDAAQQEWQGRCVHDAQHYAVRVLAARRAGRMGPVRPRGVCGPPEAVAARVAHAPVRSTGTPSVVERAHLPPRQRQRRSTRRPHGGSTELTGCETPWGVSGAEDQLVRPPQRVRARFPTPEPTRGAGAARPGRPVPPARAAGLPAHSWTTGACLASRGPIAVLDRLRLLDHLLPNMSFITAVEGHYRHCCSTDVFLAISRRCLGV